jgi:polysaccharide biosynthesis protein PslG
LVTIGNSKREDSKKKKSMKNSLSSIALFLGAILLLASLIIPTIAFAEPVATESKAAAATVDPAADRFGIASSHLARFDSQTQEAEFQAMNEIKAGWVRCTFAWSDLESAGRELWDFELADLAVQKAQEHGVKILGIMGASPPWANGGKEAWYPPTDLEAWKDYVYTVAYRYRGKVSAWEIWNEENIQFWQPAPDPVAYVQLLALAYEQIRAADPGAKVVMGGVCGLGADYLEAAFKLGALNYVDAIAYHPYADTIGEEGQPAEAKYWPKELLCRNILLAVRDLIWQYNKNPIQVWITEVGWSSSIAEVDADTQAAYDLRTMINYAATNVDKCIIYMLRDEPANIEDKAGLMTYGFTRKPSYYYYRTFEEVFGEATVEDSAAVTFTCSAPQTLEAHSFKLPNGNVALAAWKSDNKADSLSLTVNDLSYRNAMSVDLLTGKKQATPGVSRDAQGKMVVSGLAIGKTPVIIELDKFAVASIAPKEVMQHTIWLNIVVDGTGFQPGATVSLDNGKGIIEAYNLNVVSDIQITGMMGFFGVEAGPYDVVVKNPDGEEVRLENAFTVTSACGNGSGTAVLLLGISLGLLSLAGSARLRKYKK